MRKTATLLISALLASAALAGCSVKSPEDNGKPDIVATVFPEYDWVMNVAGDKADQFDITLLTDNGVDLHSFQPSTDDILTISECDIFIYVGGESDKWVDDALKNATNKDMIVIDLLDVLGDRAKVEEAVEGMQEEDEEEEEEFDEHVWLSLDNAALFTEVIADALSQIAPDDSAVFEANAADYITKLNELDARYEQTVADSDTDTLVFGDRFPFRYLTDDYGIDYYAAFAGCSAETEASFETIVFLAEKMDELDLHYIITIDGSDPSIARTIVDTTSAGDAQILTLDSMQSVTGDDIESGTTYLGIMESNLAVLAQALS